MLKRFGSLLATLLMAAALATAVLHAQDVGEPAAAMPDDIPLSSTAAVVTAAIYGTYVIKKWFARIPALAKVPVYVYTILLAIALTYVGNVIFGTLSGNLWLLIVQAVANAALASGFREWAYNLTKPLAESGTARDAATDGAISPKLPIVLLAIALGTSACAGHLGPRAVALEDATHDALASAQDGIEIVCQPPLATSTMCRETNAALVEAWDAQLAFNRAVRDGQLSAIGTLVQKVGTLVRTVAAFNPGKARDDILADLQRVVDEAFKGVR